MIHKGDTWNESTVYTDPVSLRKVRKITTASPETANEYNFTPTYHTGAAFTSDGGSFIFFSGREGKHALYKCDTATGDITCLIEPSNKMTEGGEMVMAAKKHRAFFSATSSIKGIQIDTLEERVILEHCEEGWKISGLTLDSEEETLLYSVIPQHPQKLRQERITKSYWDCVNDENTAACKLYLLSLQSGTSRLIYEEKGCGTSHCQFCPTDRDLVLFNRENSNAYVPGLKISNRIWLLRLSTGKLTELPPQDDYHFQIHATWTWDGKGVVYHGQSARGGWYVGVVDTTGQTVCEFCFTDAAYYGHVSAAVDRPAVILDGNITDNMLIWLYYDNEKPRLEIIGRHDTDFLGMVGQFSHPHALCDPTGKYIVFTAARRNFHNRARSDVFLLEV